MSTRATLATPEDAMAIVRGALLRSANMFSCQRVGVVTLHTVWACFLPPPSTPGAAVFQALGTQSLAERVLSEDAGFKSPSR